MFFNITSMRSSSLIPLLLTLNGCSLGEGEDTKGSSVVGTSEELSSVYDSVGGQAKVTLRSFSDKECQVGDAFFAPDAGQDGFRDNLDAAGVRCLSKEEDFAVKFQKEIQDGTLSRTDYQFETVIPESVDNEGGVNLVDLLETAGLIKGKDEKEFVTQYLKYQYRNTRGASDVVYYSLNAGDRVSMVNGVVELTHDLSVTSTLKLFPWDHSIDSGTEDQLEKLVAIPEPTCLESKNWSWERPSNDRFNREEDLDFYLQDGTPTTHTYLAGLARKLPSNWNLAAMPDSESGLAMQIMFDGCCDMTPDAWFQKKREAYELSESDIVVTGSRGGFVVLTAKGDYGFEPGKQGHSLWDSRTRAPISGYEAVRAELSHYDGYNENDYMPHIGVTKATVVRRGDVNGSEPYWTKVDPITDESNDNDWCDNTAPAGLVGIHYLVGNAPFWLAEGYWGGFKTFEGSDQLELLNAKKVGDKGDKVYQVQFKH
jgi:hypothetical protein